MRSKTISKSTDDIHTLKMDERKNKLLHFTVAYDLGESHKEMFRSYRNKKLNVV